MKNVLIADDSKLMRNIVKRTFEKLEIPANYFEAGNGEQALQIFSENEINLVFLDWNMPVISGLDFLKQVRSNVSYNSIPIIMVTSEASRNNMAEAIKEGATAYIVKPFKEDIFRDTLSRVAF